MKASELKERVLNRLEERGLNVGLIDFRFVEGFTGGNHIAVREVWRRNGTDENVSVDIDYYVSLGKISDYSESFKSVGSVRVPKNASDKVIDNRIDKFMEIMKQGL